MMTSPGLPGFETEDMELRPCTQKSKAASRLASERRKSEGMSDTAVEAQARQRGTRRSYSSARDSVRPDE